MNDDIAPFENNRDLIAFAERYLDVRIKDFIKDIKICLTDDENGSHAYFPALLTCLSMLDLLSGLYAGNMEKSTLNMLWRYVKKFMDPKKYSRTNVAVLYVGFRHKIAHHSHPCYVLDTGKDARIPGDKRISWMVSEKWRDAPIEILPEPGGYLKTFTPPWRVPYDHRAYLSIPHIKDDIVDSINSVNGYLETLKKDRQTRVHFAKCMLYFFPPATS